jgi:hypothetical protein
VVELLGLFVDGGRRRAVEYSMPSMSALSCYFYIFIILALLCITIFDSTDSRDEHSPDRPRHDNRMGARNRRRMSGNAQLE